MPHLPEPRTPGQYAVALVCLGNICRSPMADVVLTDRVAAAGLDDRVTVASSGTGPWHVGEPMDRRAATTLTAAGLDPSGHVARQLARGWLEEYDLVLAMDRANLDEIRALMAPECDPEQRVRLFREFDPDQPGGEVPDPYYGGNHGFEEVLGMVTRTAEAIVARLATLLDTDRVTDR